MRAVYLFQDEYPWDIRADKIVNSLADAGIQTTVVSRNRSGLPREEKIRSDITVRRLPKGLTFLDRAILNFPAFFSPFWIRELQRVVERDSSDLIIVRDLPLTPAAYFAGKRLKKPVIMDMAENYPAMIRDTWTFRGPGLCDYLIRNPVLLRQLESWIIPRMNGIWVVSEASRKRIHKITGTRTPIWVVGNTPRLENQEQAELHPLTEIMTRRDALRLLYVGGLEETRGLQTVILSLPLALEQLGKDIIFVVVGQGTARHSLRKLAADLQVGDHVYFAGWVDQKYVPGIISSADICLIPHYVTEHTDTTIPNKIFDYMAQAKAVVVTHAQTLRDIVEGCRCGRFYPDTDFRALAEVIVELNDEDIRARLGNAGRAAVLQRYHWKQDEKILLDSVAEVVDSYR